MPTDIGVTGVHVRQVLTDVEMDVEYMTVTNERLVFAQYHTQQLRIVDFDR